MNRPSCTVSYHGCRVALLAGLLLAGVAGPAAADTILELAVTLNGADTGAVGEFVQRGNDLLVRPDDWTALGFRLPASVHPGGDGLVPLSQIGGLKWHFDSATQTVTLTAPDSLRVPNTLAPSAVADAAVPSVQSGVGMTLNYDVTANYAGSQAVGNGLFDWRGFAPWGVVSSSFLGAAGGGNTMLVRLDTGFSYADVDTLRRYRVGDFIGGGLDWTRPVRMAGLQLQSDFSMRPDLITFPLPVAAGSAAVPSTVDVMVNNSHVLSQQVTPGPFQVAQLPVISGADTVTTTVTNALGQQTVTTLPFYASAQLLAPGLQSYSMETGWLRQNWGVDSDDYRKLVGAITYRRGLSDILTGEFHAEGTSNLAMAGAGLVANAFNFGTVNAALAGSFAGSRGGAQVSLGFHRLEQVFGFGVSAILADKGFRDLAALSGSPAPLRQLTASANLALGAWGSIGLAYTDMLQAGAVSVISPVIADQVPATGTDMGTSSGAAWSQANPGLNFTTLPKVQHTALMSVSYSLQLGRLSLYATGYHDFSGSGDGAMLGLTIPLGPRSSAGVSAGTGRSSYMQAQVTQSAVETGDWGYQAYATSDTDHEFVSAQYKAPWALVSAGVDRQVGLTTLRGEAQGAFTAIQGGGVFASTAISDSFAVADTSGLAGIPVMEENRLAGQTDSDGHVLVPDLHAFQVNRISVDPSNMPATYGLDDAARIVRPQEMSGVVVHFPIRHSNAAVVKLTDAAGKALPMGSAASLGDGASQPVGYDGEVYVENLQVTGNHLAVTRPDGRRCAVTFDVKPASDDIPTIGPLVCAETL